eukprot:TRINITY_DN30038_c0_g1_i1.p1 TRINITY_DN30038_c0_g1~~TRINITY_DN30038_c0_g1_i1.p1  ORF type:complete len:280 (-),score=20.58 TRINITY_DN30038_c0_g1_i1:137-976(-)
MADHRDVWRGRLYMTLSTFCFASVGALVKHIQGVTPLEKVWWRSVVSVICTVISDWRVLTTSHGPRHWKLLLLRSACGHFALWLYFTSATMIPVAENNVLTKVHPLAGAFCAYIFLGEELRARHFLATVVSIVGVVLMSNPSFSGFDTRHLIPVASGVLSGSAYCCVRALNVAGEQKHFILLSFPLFSIPFSMGDAVSGFDKLSGSTIVLLLGLGVLSQGGQVFLVRGMKHLPCASATQQMLTGSIFGVLLGIVMGEALPQVEKWVGGALILLSIYIVS